MIILTGEDREKMEYYAQRFRDAINDAIENDGDLCNKISVYQIYNEAMGLVRKVLDDEEADKMEKCRESARIRGVEMRMQKLEAHHKMLEDVLRENDAAFDNWKNRVIKERMNKSE